MIDKDKAEKAAVKMNNLQPILCDFHLHQALDPRVSKVFSETAEKEFWRLFLQCQRCKTSTDLNASIEEFRFWAENHEEENIVTWWQEYFEPNWIAEDWPELWSDIHRSSRAGLFNTNNITENMIRRLSQMFLVGKRVTTSKLLRVLLDTVVPWVRVVRVQGLENLVHRIDRASKRQEKNETSAIEILQLPNAVTPADLGPDCWNVVSMSRHGW